MVIRTVCGSCNEATEKETCRSKCKTLFKDLVKTGRGRTPANGYSTGKTKNNPETGVVQSRSKLYPNRAQRQG